MYITLLERVTALFRNKNDKNIHLFVMVLFTGMYAELHVQHGYNNYTQQRNKFKRTALHIAQRLHAFIKWKFTLFKNLTIQDQ